MQFNSAPINVSSIGYRTFSMPKAAFLPRFFISSARSQRSQVDFDLLHRITGHTLVCVAFCGRITTISCTLPPSYHAARVKNSFNELTSYQINFIIDATWEVLLTFPFM